jgi:hypothetical protein
MYLKNVAGLLTLLLVLVFSFVPAYGYFGDLVEKGIQFISMLFSLAAITALFSIWREVEIFRKRELKLIAIMSPLIVIIDTLYPLYEYSEQTYPEYMIWTQSIQFIFSLLLFYVFWKAAKK